MKNYKVYNLMLGGASITGSPGSLNQNRLSSESTASTVEFNPVPQIPNNIFPPRGGIVKNGAPAGDREIRNNNNEDISLRNLPNQTRGLVITKIENESPLLNSIEVGSIIIEAQKKKINSANELKQIVDKVLQSNQKTILLVVYNSKNQKRYIGIKLK